MKIKMKKNIKIPAFVMAMLLILSACSKKDETTFSYSKGLDKNGFWDGIKAQDYVTLADYKNHAVADVDIDNEINSIMGQKRYMKKVNISDRKILVGDTVNIDYVGSIDGVEFEGGSTGGAGTEVIIGVTSYIDDFLEQLVGHMPGEELDIEVTFPTDYGKEELNGKDAVFKTRINSIVVYDMYDLTDEFVMGVLYEDFGWSTVEEMRSGIKGYLLEDYLFKNSSFKDEMPEIVRRQYVDRMLHDTKMTAQNYGLDVNTYISYVYGTYGMTNLESFNKAIEEDSNEAAKNYMLYQAVAEAEGLKVTNDDLLKYYEDNGMAAHVAEALATYGEPFIKSMALYQKASGFIRSSGK